MFRKNILLIITIIILIGYIVFRFNTNTSTSSVNKPEITFDSNELVLSVHDNQNVLLQGVYAYDKEDGDISSQVVIESISPFIDNDSRQVNYLVFDNDDNISKASRIITYKDYTPPVYSLTDQLRASSYSLTSAMQKIKAYSCVDGDISSKITSINTTILDNKTLQLQLSVTDSTNTTSYLNVDFHIEQEANYNIEITLDKYLVYLKAGDEFNYKHNIKNIVERNIQDNSLKEYVKVNAPDMSNPGIYEVEYKISRANGNIGKTTMIVIVE